MKKILSIILVLVIALSFAACGKKNTEETLNNDVEQNEVIENEKDEVIEDEKEAEEDTEEKPEVKPEVKPEEKPEAKPEVKPEVNDEKPIVKPEEKPEAKPEAKPEEKPEEPKTVGTILLADFKAQAKGSASALSIAEALITNKVIAFGGGAMPVEEGYLTGFDNTEIKGFKEGAMFAPMIGTIPFVGYVFTLADGTNAADFISTLKSSANLRWNICTSAEEMVTGSVGNKVFFVMCPEKFDEE